MADTAIQWTDKVWNPTVGCTKISAGCKNCYAKTLHDLRHKAHGEGKKMPAQYAEPFEKLQLMLERLRDPLTWKKPQRVFVNSVSDLFHEDVPDEFLDRVFAVMAMAKQHTFQVLTKRPERMAAYLQRIQNDDKDTNAWQIAACDETTGNSPCACNLVEDAGWPLSNVWLGTSVENQAAADERIPHLLATPAAVRFLSCEPLLGPVDLDVGRTIGGDPELVSEEDDALGSVLGGVNGIDWVIVGGESGHGARPMAVEWARSLVAQCKDAGVPVFVKQLGALIHATGALDPLDQFPGGGRSHRQGPNSDAVELRLKDKKGGDMAEWPEDLRVRQFPGVS